MMPIYDLVIVGGGILGLSMASWIVGLFDGKFAILEKEAGVSAHASSRNTGIIHRPFYLDPAKKRIFAKSAQISYFLWMDWARRKELPWRQAGTLKVAIEPEHFHTLEKYLDWGIRNGMAESELEIMDGKEVEKLEPKVKVACALHCKTEPSVSYKAFAYSLFKEIQGKGIDLLTGSEVVGVRERIDFLEVFVKGRAEPIQTRYLINCAGGNSLDLARMMGLGESYIDLHFRGEYWQVERGFGSQIDRNIYSVPQHKEFPFLDPHLIVRADGRREVGPNAVLVSGPNTYGGIANDPLELISKVLERPFMLKLRLFMNHDFFSLVSKEWRSSLFASEMCSRVRKFIPSLRREFLVSKGVAGVRSAVIDRSGFVPEVIELESPHSYHILNYNSPGATGAPAYTGLIVSKLMREGRLGHLKTEKAGTIWSLDEILDGFND